MAEEAQPLTEAEEKKRNELNARAEAAARADRETQRKARYDALKPVLDVFTPERVAADIAKLRPIAESTVLPREVRDRADRIIFFIENDVKSLIAQANGWSQPEVAMPTA